jgi:signal transduction histidine kinase
VQDVTAQRASDEALGKLRSELAHMSRVATLGALTASIAHEVNQPLSGIITNASTCLRMLDADPLNIEGARETARRTIRDGNRASDVIKRLRALFSKKDFIVEPVDLNDATQEVTALLRNELQRSQIILQTDLAKDLPPAAGDRVQLQQVILNLLLNAVDAMSDVDGRPRHLTVTTQLEEDDRVRLSVSDVGVGFAAETSEKLFNAFYTTKKGGMGIGLSVSRSIIERHKGQLWASSNDGPGAVFSFSIPVQGEWEDKRSGIVAADDNL